MTVVVVGESVFLSNAPRFPKGHCVLEDSQASFVDSSGKSNIERLWNDTVRGTPK